MVELHAGENAFEKLVFSAAGSKSNRAMIAHFFRITQEILI